MKIINKQLKINNQKGMSLLDSLLAVTVFAIVGMSVLGMYANMNKVYQEGTEQANLQRGAELLLNMMAREIREAKDVQECNNCGPVDDKTHNGIRITTLPNPPAASDTIEYYLMPAGARRDIRKIVNAGADVDLSNFEAELIGVAQDDPFNNTIFDVTPDRQEVFIRFNMKDPAVASNGIAIDTMVRRRN